MRGRGERENDNQQVLKPLSKYFTSISFKAHQMSYQGSYIFIIFYS